MKQKIRYGLLGCGMMGQEHLRNLKLIEGAEVAAIVEPDAQMRALCQSLVPDVVFLEDLKALCSFPQLDALIIASPNHCHVSQLLSIIKKVQLPILIEKPLAINLQEVQEVRQLVADYPAPIWVAMEYRYMPPVAEFIKHLQTAKSSVDIDSKGAAQRIGDLKMLTIKEHRFPFLQKVAHWNRFNRNTGGALVEKCCHFFDLMRLIMAEEAVSVYASAGQDVNHIDEYYDGERSDILDNAYVIINFASGKRALLELCMFAEGARYQEEIAAVGSQAKLETFVPGPGRFWPHELGAAPIAKLVLSHRDKRQSMDIDIPVDPDLLEAGDHNGSTYYQHVKFHHVITANAAVEVSIEDGLKAVVLGLAAQASAATGQVMRMTDAGYAFEPQT